jgi:hypothetical protein
MAVLCLSYAGHENANRFRRPGVPLVLWLVIHRFELLSRLAAIFRLNSAWGRNSSFELRLVMNKKTKVAIAVAGGFCLIAGSAWVLSSNFSAACNKPGPGWMAVAPRSGTVYVSTSENSPWSRIAHLLGIRDRDCSTP